MKANRWNIEKVMHIKLNVTCQKQIKNMTSSPAILTSSIFEKLSTCVLEVEKICNIVRDKWMGNLTKAVYSYMSSRKCFRITVSIYM